MLNKIKASLAYRLPVIYKKILSFRRLKTKPKTTSNLVVITMTGKNHMELTRFSILSIANKWSSLPKLLVYSDGSITTEAIRYNLSFWKGELEIQDWSFVLSYHENLGRETLLKYANIDSFGKKMALILFHSDKYPVIWIDSDILFFRDFIPYIPQYNGFVCGGSEDWTQAFDYRIIRTQKSSFDADYKFNAGILYISGKNIFENFQLEKVLKEIHPNYDFLTEQTIFANISNRSLGILWKQETIGNFHTDNQDIKSLSIDKIVGRHYVSNVRHLFWRDAFLHFKYLNNPE
ncbi:hypothetical protein [Pedobacter aquatilis]|uniref:hypothetical protein n=1 Tax=Pedobacter aquatilis TaxID=351343 RepID=UPI00292CBC4B|nr:hypothetical protein [Pedobacter aquatilis]